MAGHSIAMTTSQDTAICPLTRMEEGQVVLSSAQLNWLGLVGGFNSDWAGSRSSDRRRMGLDPDQFASDSGRTRAGFPLSTPQPVTAGSLRGLE